MATVNGSVVDLISEEDGYAGEGTSGRFITWSGTLAYMGDGKETTYYKLRGYYVVGTTYEEWVSTDPDSSPPSGHTLIDTHIVNSWSGLG